MEKTKILIQRNINGKKVLFFVIITNLVYAFMLLVTIPKTMSFSNNMKLLDMMPTGYNFEYVKTLFNTLGESGREAYLYTQIPVDLIYPLLFSIAYCLLIAFFLNKLDKLNSVFYYICYLPVIAGFFDYMENFGIIVMLNKFPDLSENLSLLTNLFTILKSAFTTIYFAVLIITIVVFGFRRIFAKS